LVLTRPLINDALSNAITYTFGFAAFTAAI